MEEESEEQFVPCHKGQAEEEDDAQQLKCHLLSFNGLTLLETINESCWGVLTDQGLHVRTKS